LLKKAQPDARLRQGRCPRGAQTNAKITFNGKEYESPEAMPPEVREAYERAMEIVNNGGSGIKSHVNIKLSTSVRFVDDGKVYNSPDEMPADVHQKYEIAMQQIDQNKNGIPDFLEDDVASKPETDSTSSPEPLLIEPDAPIAPMTPQPPVIAPDRSNGVLMVVAGLIIIVLLLVIFGLFLYIYQR
jgi:hypothetical protein